MASFAFARIKFFRGVLSGVFQNTFFRRICVAAWFRNDDSCPGCRLLAQIYSARKKSCFIGWSDEAYPTISDDCFSAFAREIFCAKKYARPQAFQISLLTLHLGKLAFFLDFLVNSRGSDYLDSLTLCLYLQKTESKAKRSISWPPAFATPYSTRRR